VLRAILERCCVLSSEYIEERGGLYEVLTSDEMLESDVAGEREDRRTAQGFVAPADARSFLELARRGEQLDTRDPMTKAYFRALASEKPARPDERGARAAGAALTSPGDVTQLVQLLEDAAVVEPAGSQPSPALAPGSLPAGTEQELLLQAALAELRSRKPELFSQRLEELGYLANVLIAGSRDRRPRPVEALEQAIAVCNTGLERALGADRALARAVELLETTPADRLFRRGYRA
jgi:hypothetical protein